MLHDHNPFTPVRLSCCLVLTSNLGQQVEGNFLSIVLTRQFQCALGFSLQVRLDQHTVTLNRPKP